MKGEMSMTLPAINKSLAIGIQTSRTQGHILVLHSTATPNAPAYNIASYEHRVWRSAETFVHFAVDDKSIYQIGTPGYRAWGAGNVNSYAPVQIELCEFGDRAKALKAYKLWVELAVTMAKRYGVPLTLDDSNRTYGIKTHNWCSRTYGGSDHSDPYGYLASIGITKAQLAKDLKAGHATGTISSASATVTKAGATSSAGKLVVDGDWGAATTKRLQQVYKTPVDGIISGQYPWKNYKGAVTGFQYDTTNPAGSQVIAAIQRSLGLKADGLLRPATIKAMQKRAGTPVDGVISPNSRLVIYIQQQLNTGKKPF